MKYLEKINSVANILKNMDGRTRLQDFRTGASWEVEEEGVLEEYFFDGTVKALDLVPEIVGLFIEESFIFDPDAMVLTIFEK